MPDNVLHIHRLPFSRSSIIRRTAGHRVCLWCGQKRRTTFQYGVDPDAGPTGWYGGAFCNLECAQSYHGDFPNG